MTQFIIPHVEGVPWDRWSETVVGFNSSLSNQLGVAPEAAWREWATNLALFIPTTPRPEPFSTWQAWGDALRSAVFG